MIDYIRYSKKDIKNITALVDPIYYIGFEKYPDETFMQLHIGKTYIPYLISSYGRIFSIHFSNKKYNIKQLSTNMNNGYERITITYNHHVMTLSIHRLVAQYFIPNPNNDPEVNHKDGNKQNNCVWNLEWVTPSENIQHAFRIGLRKIGEENPRSKFTNAQILLVCQMLEKNYSIKDIIKRTNVSEYVIKDIIRGLTWTNISKDYDFSNYNYGKDPKDVYINKLKTACEMIQNNESIKSIKEETGLTSNIIYKLLHYRTNTNITKYYDFSNYNYGKI